jgi:hypothetical protein
MFDFSRKITRTKLEEFANLMIELSDVIGEKISARGWCYIMEGKRYINKDQFDKVEEAINRCRREGLLPVDFVAEEKARMFENVEIPTEDKGSDMAYVLDWMLRDVLNGHKYYIPDWWDGEKYYIQMVVEKVDLVTFFQPVCKEYHIPIANAKGWSSILQRAEYARRFKEAEEKGLQCVLLYCGDHDPDGLRISDTLRNNLEQVKDIRWDDAVEGYDPTNLEIHRFGLNYDFILRNRYTWIDNLITGSGKNLASPLHRNYKLAYVQAYLKKIGIRKCEANAIVTTPDIAKALVRDEIERWLGKDAKDRFRKKRDKAIDDYNELLEESNLSEPINDFLNRDY